eukprot:Gb_35374 [translate_table: standard]
MGSQESPIPKEDDDFIHIAKIPELCDEDLKIIEWEDFQNDLVRLWSLCSTRNKAKAKREALVQRLEAILEVRKQSLCRANELEAMQRKLDSQKQRMQNAVLSLKEKIDEVHAKEEKLMPSIRSLLGASKALAAAHGRLQEANRLLAGEGGYGHFRHLQKMLSARQQLMVAQVASLYPLARFSSQRVLAEEFDSLSQQQILGGSAASTSVPTSSDSTVESLTIAGLQLFAPPVKRLNFLNDRQEYQSSATALGYVAHVVKLVASYLDIPLRYPLRLGGSRSYIQDYAPSAEPATTDSISVFGVGTSSKAAVEFPLFLEGQEPTRSAYAVFLLNKDLEQMLNYIGVQSLGLRHTLPNLKRLIKTILSEEYLLS